MVSNAFLTLVSLLAVANAQDLVQRSTSNCSDVHIFLARGNNEPYPGRQAALVEAVCQGLSSCDYEDLIYSALYTDEYCQSVYDGAIAGFVQMAEYASRCPNSKFILGGYSQGAQIATDILGGGGGVSFNGCVQPNTPAMNRKTAPGNMISAVVVFGNVRHTASQAYNYASGSAINGLFPHDTTQLANLDGWTDVLRDWCVDTDPECAAGQSNYDINSHLDYYDLYASAAGSWVKSVASLTVDSNFVTSIPISISGTAQDYATIGTATPSGAVVIDTTWTAYTAVTPVTTSSTSSTSSSGTPSTTSSGNKATITHSSSTTVSVSSNSTVEASTSVKATAQTTGSTSHGTTASTSTSASASASKNAGANTNGSIKLALGFVAGAIAMVCTL